MMKIIPYSAEKLTLEFAKEAQLVDLFEVPSNAIGHTYDIKDSLSYKLVHQKL